MAERRDAAQRAWLREELPALVEARVIDEAAAARLRSHYALDELGSTTSRAILVLAVMGAALIGAGILLLVAHNWEEMSRPARAGLCFALLLFAQATCGFAVARRPASDAWREASAAFLTASFGTALSLVSQTYHVQGELGDMVLGWVALMLPVVYVLDARVSAGALALLALFLPLGRDHAFDRGYSFLFVLAALAPFVYRAGRAFGGERRTAWLEVACVGSFALGTAMLVARDAPAILAVWLMGVFVAAYVAPSGETNALAGRALRGVAAAAIGATSLALTFRGAWEELYRSLDRWGREEALWTFAAALVAATAFGRLASHPPERRRHDAAFASALLPMWAAFGLGFLDASPKGAAAIFNLFALGLGLVRLFDGLRGLDRRRSNFGLALLGGLFVVRFFDSEISFVARGLGMVAIGVAFLAVNFYLARKGEGAEG